LVLLVGGDLVGGDLDLVLLVGGELVGGDLDLVLLVGSDLDTTGNNWCNVWLSMETVRELPLGKISVNTPSVSVTSNAPWLIMAVPSCTASTV
jgi:hypothetical protein